jgi:predicted N-formylglutamate amidohydrolase
MRAAADDDPPLRPDDDGVFEIVRPGGASPYFLVCDHAGRRLLPSAGSLGLPASELERHIAWDIGIGGVSSKLAERIDAFLIRQSYSRLMIDCNRPTESPDSIATISETTRIPGNEGISRADAEARARMIFHPYHDRIRAELDARQASGRRTVLVAMHSFTPSFKGVSRPWHVGVLYNRDARLAGILLALLRQEPGLVVGDNEPYRVTDTSDYTVIVHGERRAIPCVEIEIRQDLITDDDGQAQWAERFARLLQRALPNLTSYA